MRLDPETVALVALLRLGRRSWGEYARQVERACSATTVLTRELGIDPGQTTLFGDDTARLARATAELHEWLAGGIRLLTVLDDEYPRNLREVLNRPPVVFVAGCLGEAEDCSIAMIGSRRASPEGIELAEALSAEFVASGYTVISGLAAGIDAAAHRSALRQGGQTVAVLGTGLAHCYPRENAALQRTIAEQGAVVSQFWPESPPQPGNFLMRNEVMSGLSRGSVIVEASERSGARAQARLALAHGRPVFLLQGLLAQAWARELASRDGVHVVCSAKEVIAAVETGPGGERARQ